MRPMAVSASPWASPPAPAISHAAAHACRSVRAAIQHGCRVSSALRAGQPAVPPVAHTAYVVGSKTVAGGTKKTAMEPPAGAAASSTVDIGGSYYCFISYSSRGGDLFDNGDGGEDCSCCFIEGRRAGDSTAVKKCGWACCCSFIEVRRDRGSRSGERVVEVCGDPVDLFPSY